MENECDVLKVQIFLSLFAILFYLFSLSRVIKRVEKTTSLSLLTSFFSFPPLFHLHSSSFFFLVSRREKRAENPLSLSSLCMFMPLFIFSIWFFLTFIKEGNDSEGESETRAAANPWKAKAQVEKTKEEEFEEYFEGLFP